MNPFVRGLITGLGIVTGVGLGIAIADFSIPNPEFHTGDKISAQAVSDNFTALTSAVTALQNHASEQDADVADMSARLTQLENEAQRTVVAAYRIGDQTIAAAGTYVDWNGEILDPNGDLSGTTFTATKDGPHLVCAWLQFAANQTWSRGNDMLIDVERRTSGPTETLRLSWIRQQWEIAPDNEPDRWGSMGGGCTTVVLASHDQLRIVASHTYASDPRILDGNADEKATRLIIVQL